MNVILQSGGLALVLILIYFSITQKIVGLRSARLYLALLFCTLSCLIFDISSIIAITYRAILPSVMVDFFAKFYLFTLVMEGSFSFLYASFELYDEKRYKLTVLSVSAINTLTAALIAFLPIGYVADDKVLYSEGPAVITTYIVALGYILGGIFICIKYKSKINKRRSGAVLSWYALWCVASVIQFFNNALLIVGFATALGMLIIYARLENPEANMDRDTGLYNGIVLREYMTEKYSKNEPFSTLTISFDKSESGFIKKYELELLLEISNYLTSFKNALVFKNTSREFVLLFKNSNNLMDAYHEIYERFLDYWHKDIMLFPLYVLLPDSTIAKNVDELNTYYSYGKVGRDDNSKDTVKTLDEAVVAELKEFESTKLFVQKALDENRLEIFLQPIYSTKARRFTSAEALVRIRDTDGSIVPPGLYVPVIEMTNLITRVGERVFEKVCAFLQRYSPEETGLDYIEVNLSVAQCEQEDLADKYINIMKNYKTDPKRINLEITESASIKAHDTLLKNMEALVKYGVNFSLDDFGTGESNLNYVVTMPVFIVKFDMSMTQAYFKNEKAKIVMEHVISMVHELNLETVAEGVEEEKEYERLLKLGIDHIQGYYFSRPLAIGDFLVFIKEKNNLTEKE